MENKKIENLLTIVLSIIVIGVLIKIFKGLMDSTKTEIISEKGLNALSNPDKKRMIDKAFEEAAQKQRVTGVWENPELDLS
jgi:hypothetical protein